MFDFFGDVSRKTKANDLEKNVGLTLLLLSVCGVLVQFLSSGKGVRLGLVVEGDGGRLGLALDDLSTTTHPLRSSELDRQGPGDTECV
jgi:hypothetical protein